jgi:hypothetical protein
MAIRSVLAFVLRLVRRPGRTWPYPNAFLNYETYGREFSDTSLPRRGLPLSEADSILAPPGTAPILAEDTLRQVCDDEKPHTTEIRATMTRQRANRNGHDRRQDPKTAALVEVGLLFVKVFGKHTGQRYFRCTVVAPHVYQRVLLGPRRPSPSQGDTGDMVSTD